MPDFTDNQAFLWLLLLVPLAWGLWTSLVDRPAKLKWASFALRALGLALLVVGLAQPFLNRERRDAHLNFLVDVSASVQLDAIKPVLDDIEKATKQLGASDSFTLYALGDGIRAMSIVNFRAMIEKWSKGVSDDAFRAHTRLADGMLASRLSFPGGKARRLIVCSDGVETDANLDAAIKQLKDEAVDVCFRSIKPLSDPEASVASLESSSSSAFESEIVRLTARVKANTAMQAKVRLIHKGVAMTEKPVTLEANKELPVTFDAPMATSGASVWGVEIVPEKDHFPINNHAETVIKVEGKPRVLVIHDDPKDMRTFAQSLRSQQFEVDVRGKRGLPVSLDELSAFDAVMLSNIAASDMTMRQMELIRQYVSDLGGGLIMLGSENSYGLGGYYKTPVEEVLPLVSRFEKEKEKPSMALALVIDKSGSMEGVPIALARQAAKMAVELLTGRDQVAVVGFDSEAQTICEMTPASDVGSIQASIDSLAAGGGTNMYPGMEVGGEMLRNAAAKVKHMILLTDGISQESDFLGLTQRLVDEGVTVSCVALGDGAAREILSQIAEAGRGRYYETADPANVPQIFTRETMQASKSAIQEDLFPPIVSMEHPLISGVRQDALPAVLGFVMTQAKPTAQTLLSLETGDPLLAVGRFGLGTGLCFTSDLTDKWGAEWLGWESCGSCWAQVLRGVARKADVDGVEVKSTIVNNIWHLRIDCTDTSGSPLSAIPWDAAIADENGAAEKLTVNESGLGRYEVAIPLAGRSAFTVRLHDTLHNKLIVKHYRAPYPNEYQLGVDPAPMLAKANSFDPAQPTEGLAAVTYPVPVQSWSYLTALAALLGSIVLRRL